MTDSQPRGTALLGGHLLIHHLPGREPDVHEASAFGCCHRFLNLFFPFAEILSRDRNEYADRSEEAERTGYRTGRCHAVSEPIVTPKKRGRAC